MLEIFNCVSDPIMRAIRYLRAKARPTTLPPLAAGHGDVSLQGTGKAKPAVLVYDSNLELADAASTASRVPNGAAPAARRKQEAPESGVLEAAGPPGEDKQLIGGREQRPAAKAKTARRSPFNAEEPDGLERFTNRQRAVFQRALREIQNGHKDSCWMWFIIPTPPYIVNGVEKGSATNRKYSLRSNQEVHDFLAFEAEGVHLGRNYLDILKAVRDQLQSGVKAVSLVGILDEPKLRSSVRLFERITRKPLTELERELHPVVAEVLRLLKEEPDP